MSMERRKYTREMLEEACAASQSVSGVLRYLGLKPGGGAHSHVSQAIKDFGIDFGWQGAGGGAGSTLRAEQLLTLREDLTNRVVARQLRRALREIGREEVCEGCGLASTWQDKPITLEVDHIDGNWKDNRPENLRILCPNCHSQTETYCKKKTTCE